MNRNRLSNRRRTTIAQCLPDDLIEKQQAFLAFIMYRRIQHDYPLAYIGNMDETPVSFDLPANITVDELGARSVSIRTTGHERSNFTVVLTCMADGTKLPPLIIFKIKNILRGNFPPEVIIRANKKGWMNENEMLYWIENVWAKRERFSNPQSLLVLDSFSAHIVDSIKRRFGEKKTNIAIIPRGLTSRLQPLDVSVNKSFKSKMRRYYNEWMAETIKELTPTGKFRRPSYETVAHWVKDSWDAVDVNLIQRSFKCCGISNKRDGTEDDWIFNYDRLKQNNQLNDEVVVLSDKEDESDGEYENDEDEEYDDEEEEDNEYEDDDDDDEEEEEEEEEDECDEEEEESEYREEEDGYDDEYFGYYEQGTNYVNIWE
ncbi:hypothetical protein RclHR1_01000005 [Rhizophagus clarus]|uniref:DDE-1 domain-containing protein n=1 Tax=Rhizophagus clarus TaxID=94130 RepID=A0A2Z6QC41_9GLOM|nr:hypothetical protein RclHR1_01000005 [Rhizophagus clarus]